MLQRAIACLLVLALPVGCLPTAVPPPQVPERLLPDVPGPAPEPAAGKGQVTIAADEPSLVEQVTGTYEGVSDDGYAVSGVTYAPVCAQTPCVASLDRGDHALRLTSLIDPQHNGTGTITVDDAPTAYRYALGHNVGPAPGRQVGGIFALTYGGLIGIGGAVFIGLGKQTDTDFDGNPGATHDWTPLGIGMTVVGVGLIALGWHLLQHTGGQTQDGAGVQWTP